MLRKPYVKLISMVLTTVLLCGAFTETFAYSERILPYAAGYAAVKNVDLNGTFADSPSVLERYRSMLGIAKAGRTAIEPEAAEVAGETEEAAQPEWNEQKAVEYAVSQVSPAIQTAQTAGSLLLVEEMDSAWSPAVDENTSGVPNNPDMEMGDGFGMNEEAGDELSAQDDSQVLDISEANEGMNSEDDENINAEGDVENKESASDEDGRDGGEEEGADSSEGSSDESPGDKGNGTGGDFSNDDQENSGENDGQEDGGREEFGDEGVLPQEPDEEIVLLDEPEVLLADVVLFSGEGTAESPFLIENEEQFFYLASLFDGSFQDVPGASVHYRLTADLDLRDAAEFYGIGSQAVPFQGVFNGDGHTVWLDIDAPDTNYVGLFSYAKNASLMNINIEGSVIGNDSVGSLAGFAENTVVTEIKNIGVINGNKHIGGIVGQAGYIEITRSQNSGEVTAAASTSYAGGILGSGYDAEIQECINIGDVRGQRSTGGIVGDFFGTIRECHVYGSVFGTYETGGILGGWYGSVYNSTFRGEKVSGIKPGIIAADSIEKTIINCGYYVRGNITPWDAQILPNGKAHNENNVIREESGNFSIYVPVMNTTFGTSSGDIQESISFTRSGYNLKKVYISENNEKNDYRLSIGEVILNENSTADSIQGEGTEEAPFLIENEDQIIYIVSELQGGNLKETPAMDAHYKLMADLDFSDIAEFYGIGSQTTPFGGVFDGNGHQVELNISAGNENYAGLFRYTSGGEIQNVVINGRITGRSYLGGIAGYARETTITNVSIDIIIQGYGSVGGVAGYSYGASVSSSHVTGRIEGTSDNVGGIAGYAINNSSIYDVINDASVSGNAVGGIAGTLNNSVISSTLNNGMVHTSNGYSTHTGGIAGNVSASIIENSQNNGSVSNGTYSSTVLYTGGIAGRINNASLIEECINTGNVSSSRYPGGIAGQAYGGSIIRSSTFAGDQVSGSIICLIAGHESKNFTIENSGFLIRGKIDPGDAHILVNNVIHDEGMIERGEDGSFSVFMTVNTDENGTVIGESLQNVIFLKDGYDQKKINISIRSILNIGDIVLEENSIAGSIQGEGTEESPFLIENEEQLLYIVESLQGTSLKGVPAMEAHYRLVSDLDLSNKTGFYGIGTVEIPFSGTLDGNNRQVKLNISASRESYLGLFRYLEGAEIRNIAVAGNLTGDEYIGGITGYASNSSINNVSIEGNFKGSYYIGGIAGYGDRSVFAESTYSGTISGGYFSAGIVGRTIGSEIIGNRVEGTVTGSSNTYGVYSGGVAGTVNSTVLYNNIIENAAISKNALIGTDNGDNHFNKNVILLSAETSVERPDIAIGGFEDISPEEAIGIEYTEHLFTVSIPVNQVKNNAIEGASLRISKEGYFDRHFILKASNAGFNFVLPESIELYLRADMALDVTGVSSPVNADIDTVQKTITASVVNFNTINITLETSVGTVWKLYSDQECSIEISNRILSLEEGWNTAYILISNDDGSSQVYTLNVFNEHQRPSTVTGLLAIGNTNQIQLRWDMAYEAGVNGYNLYRSEDPDSGYTKITTINSRNTLSYTDQKVTPDQVYYYKVSSFIYANIESDLSDYVSAAASFDTQPPVILGISPIDDATVGKYTDITVRLEDNIALKEVWLEYQIDEDGEWVFIDKKSISGTSAAAVFNLGEILHHGPIRVRALAEDHNGNMSDGNPVRLYYLDTTGPEKVTGFSGTPTESAVTLRWNDVADRDFAYFAVEQKNEGEAEYTQIAKVTSTLGHHVTGLTPDTNYWFRVRAFDIYDNPGEYSDEIQVYTQGDAEKPRIISIRPMPGYYTSLIPVTVNASDNIAVASIEVELSTDETSWKPAASKTVENPAKNVTLSFDIDISLIPEGSVFVRAFAEDTAGNRSNPSSVVEHRIDRTPPAAPTGLTVESTAEYILLQWEKGNETDLRYYSVYRSDDGSYYRKISGNLTSLGYYDQQTVHGNTYYYRITAVDAAGNESNPSAVVSASLAEDTTAPWIYSVSPKDGSILGPDPTIRVQARDNVDLAQIIVEYFDAGDWYTIGKSNVSGTSASASFTWDTDRIPPGEYTVRFYAVDRAGNTGDSYEVEYELRNYVIARPVAVLTPGNMSITISWKPISHTDPVRYRVYRIDKGRDVLLTEIDVNGETSYTDHRLDPAQVYEYFVEAYDARGNVSPSEVVSAQPVNNDPYPPVANAGFDMNTLVGVQTAFNGDLSTDNIGIAKYLWDFGDGTSCEGEKTVHVYQETGTYTVTLTVEDDFGNRDSDSIQVKALLPSQAGTVLVKVVDNETGETLSDASVYIDLPEEPMLLRTDENGEVSIAAEPGTYGVSAYKIGYLPKEISVKVEQYGDTKTTLGISKGQLVIGEVITERLTLDQIGELGIDTTDPDNRHVFNFKVSLIFQEKEYDYDFNIDRWGNFYAGGSGYKRWKIDYDDQSAYVHAVPSKNPEVPPTLSILTVSNSVGFLKEFYSVSVVMQNMADPQFVLTDNVYRLNLPSGLSLADTAEKQDYSIQADDLPGGEVSMATWIVRGDKAGSYKLSVNYNGTLMPFEEPVEAVFSTDEDLMVDGSQGLKIYVWADEYGFPGEDYYIAFAVHNSSNFPRYDIKATFGDNLPTIRYEYTLVDENGNKSQHTSTEGTTYVVETPDQMHRIPVLTSHDSILMQTLVPGEAFFGYYQTTFPGSDPETFYHELIDGFSEILGGSTVDIPVILLSGSHLRPGGYWELGTWANGSGINDLGYFELEEEVLKVTGVSEIPFNLRYYSGYTSPHEDDIFNEGPDDDAWDFPASGWSSSYEMKAVTQIDGTINLYLAPGIGLRFIHEDAKNRVIPGELKNGNVYLRAASLAGNYFSKDIGYQNYKLVKNDDDTIVLTDPDKTNYYFNKDGRLVRIENHQKQVIEISRIQTGEDARVLIISEPGSDQKIVASYDGSGNLTGVRDNLGREVGVEHERTSEGLSVGSLITASGDKVSYEYDGFNVTRKSVNGKTIFSQTFDDKGRVTSRTDGEGRTSQFEYDDEITFWQTATKTTDRNGSQQVTIANRQGQTISETDGLGHTSYYTYNAGGRMTSARDANGNTRIFDYDEDDNLISTEDPEGIKESITYDDRGNMLTFTAQTGAVTTYEYSDKNWLLKKVDERGVVTQYTYNDYGQVLTETVLGLGTTHYTYENGRLASTTDVLGQTERLQYDAAGRPVSSTDRDGNTTHFAYDVMDQLIKVADPRGYEIHYAYDDQGNVISQTDQRGNVTSYEYDGNGNLVKETNALGEAFTYEYDGEGNLVKTTSPEGSFVQYVYDAAGQQTAVIDPEEGVTAYEYDPAGQLVKTIYPNGGTHTVQYDRSGRKTSETNPLSGTTTYQYNNVGQLALVTDPAGNSRWYTYDASGNPLSARDGEGGTVSAEYDIYGRLVSQTDANGNKMLFAYDQKGQRIKETDPLGNAVSYTYNGRGQIVKQTDAKGGEISVLYDGTGNPTAVTNALGNTIAMEYDEAGNQTVMRDAYGTAIETITYDALNRQVASTDALGNTKRIEYDSVGRKTAEITALNEVTTFTYNKRGQLLTQTEPEGGVTVYTYDAEGNMTSLRDPMEGLSSYFYDAAGNLIREQKANGGVKTYTYNTAGQLIQSVNARGQKFEYTYDRAGRVTEEEGIHYTYDSNGNVLTVRNGQGTLFRTYDALNRVTSYSGIYGDMIRYVYDEAGNLTEITYPDGKAVKYTYDPAGQMKTVTDYSGRVTSYQYNKNGNLVKTEYPNGVAEELAYGLNGWMESRTSKKGTTVVSSGTYTYDGNGNLVVEMDDAMRARNDYDKNGRLTEKSDTWYTGRRDTYFFTYDAAGNMLHEDLISRPGSAGRQTDMSYGPGNQAELWNGQALSFDPDGNMTRGPLDGVFSAFEYDQRNQLIRAGSTRYTYDGDGTRVGQSITGGRSTQYTVNSNAALSQLLVKKDSDGSSTYYVYGNSLISQERIDAEGGREYRVFHYDFRGSTVAMTDQYGNVTDRITYDPYGAITSRTGSTDTIFLYNGKYGVQTDDNGLIYMRARYYSTDLKRFISEDPKKDRVNWYIYGNSNPLNYIDPEGTIAPAVLAVIGIVEVGLWIYSGYSFVQAVKNKDWLGAVISGIGFFIPPAAVVRGASAAWRGASAAWRGASAAWRGAGAGSRVVSNIARAANGVMRGAGAGAKAATVATTASNTVRSGSTVMKMAGSGGRVGSGLSGAGGIARLAGGASAAGSGVRYLLTGNGINTPRLTEGIPKVNLNELPANVQQTLKRYDETGWKGNFPEQTPRTKAGGTYKNATLTDYSHLPTHDAAGNRITYREFDVNNKIPNVERDAERFVLGSDGSIYYTDNHYGEGISPTGMDSFVKIIQ